MMIICQGGKAAISVDNIVTVKVSIERSDFTIDVGTVSNTTIIAARYDREEDAEKVFNDICTYMWKCKVGLDCTPTLALEW